MKSGIFLTLRLAVGLVFAASGFLKLIEPAQNFQAVILSYELLTGPAAQGAAIAVPWAELILGAFLMAGLWDVAVVVSLWLLNSAFIVLVSQVLIRRLPIKDCGCFGESFFSLSPKQALGLDVAIWLALAFLYLDSLIHHAQHESGSSI